MSKKAAKSKEKVKASPGGPRFPVMFTRRRLLLWSGIVFVAMVWMFTLGVLVGRGLSPVHFDVKRLKKELIALKQKATKTSQADSEIETNTLSENPELGFYEVLTDREEEPGLKPEKVKSHAAESDEKHPEASEADKTDEHEKPEIKLTEVDKKRTKIDKGSKETTKVDGLEGEGLLTIQVASLQDAEEAGQMVRLLKSKGYQAYSVTLSLLGGNTYHRVRVGRFSDSSEASRVAASLKRAGFNIMIFRE
jgi:cell division septation protein DedD